MPRTQTRDSEQAEAFTDDESGLLRAGEELLNYIVRAERLEEEIAGIRGDLKDLFAEAKGRGFSAQALKTILKRRKEPPDEREQLENDVELYERAIAKAERQPKH